MPLAKAQQERATDHSERSRVRTRIKLRWPGELKCVQPSSPDQAAEVRRLAVCRSSACVHNLAVTSKQGTGVQSTCERDFVVRCCG